MAEEPGVRLPGERRRRHRERAEAEGLKVAEELLARIRLLAGEETHA
jgi:LDH2 family malate/lactate/ureidoglycolate dehydrogenase